MNIDSEQKTAFSPRVALTPAMRGSELHSAWQEYYAQATGHPLPDYSDGRMHYIVQGDTINLTWHAAKIDGAPYIVAWCARFLAEEHCRLLTQAGKGEWRVLSLDVTDGPDGPDAEWWDGHIVSVRAANGDLS